MPPRMNQIALSVGDRQVSREFYRGLFGLPQVGGTHFQGKVTEKVQGLPGASSDVYWHMDDREFFQLELFQFECPVPRPYAALRKPWDIGYSRLAIEVTDPVRLHAICRERSVPGLAPVKSVRGKPHFVLRDPNGVLVEVGPASRLLGAHVGARLAGVGMSVPNLDVAVNSFQCVIGCPVLDASPVDKGALCLPPRTRRPQRPPRHPRGRPSSLRRLSSWSHPSPSTQIPCWPRC